MNAKDAILTKQKRQHDMGQYETMKYFDKDAKIKKLTWLVIFDDIKAGEEGEECDSLSMLCHCET